jgi:hypothetical protein
VSLERILAHFREQAAFCTSYGSPFTGDLINAMADDLEGGGPTAALVAQWPTNPRADALSLRMAGALHAAVLTNRDPVLAALYPGYAAAWRVSDVWPVARAFLERERDWVADFIRSAPQTNETRRSIALLSGFLTFAQSWSGPVDTLEIGASAGLNLNWDRFAYRTQTWSWGDPSPVLIDTDWSGPAPPMSAKVNVRNRAACDLNPLDIRDEAQRLQLKSYIWPDQPDRLARFEGAVALAIANHARVERADAAEWIADRLARRAQDAATIVYHSIFLQYPPREARKAIVDALQAAGANATPEAPLAWVRLEPEGVTDGIDTPRMVIDLHTWPGGERRVLGYTDGHVRAIYAV